MNIAHYSCLAESVLADAIIIARPYPLGGLAYALRAQAKGQPRLRDKLQQIPPVRFVDGSARDRTIGIEKSYRFFLITQCRNDKAARLDDFDKFGRQ
jgi:hypothetical protein